MNQNLTNLLNKEVKGELPRGILLEKMVDISKELYLSIFLNRSKRCFSIIASAEGGVDIEQTENKVIHDLFIDGISLDIANDVANKLNIPDSSKSSFVDLLLRLFKLSLKKKQSLLKLIHWQFYQTVHWLHWMLR